MRDDSYKKNETPLDKVWIKFLALQEKYEELRQVKTQMSQKHYGQVLFDYNPQMDTVTISLKHKEKQTVVKTIKRDDFTAYYDNEDRLTSEGQSSTSDTSVISSQKTDL
ncbi:hypothetical protein [Legionella tunisiensis]|uniref:hypothetical protein n=1 Tax=Legionella tunisiensis TaxID=1034944 RepID=UPI00031A53ED|nr:hypothetical protein [Legionella tunisiensis]